jgi:uncharacterized membrane protein
MARRGPKQKSGHRGTPNVPAQISTNNLPDPQIRQAVEKAIGTIVGGGPQRVQVVERVVSLIRTEMFRGPLPHPSHFEEYEKICPGSADRIIRMAEFSQARREDRNDKLVELEYGDRRLGLKFGFSSLISFVVAGTGLCAFGQVYVGAGLLSAAAIGTVVGTFVHGRIPFPGRKDDKAKSSDEKKTPGRNEPAR